MAEVWVVNASPVIVLDDAEARRCARTLGVPLIGTLGIVLRAQRLRLIPSAQAIVQDLRDAGLRLDEDVLRKALARIEGHASGTSDRSP